MAEEKHISRRSFLKSLAGGLFYLSLPMPCSYAAAENREQRLEEKLKGFAGYADPSRLRRLERFFNVHLNMDYGINLETGLSMMMKRCGDDYISTFRLEEPEAPEGDAYSFIMMALFGKRKKEYKEMVKSLNVRLFERFRLEDKRFCTVDFEEKVFGKPPYKNHSCIRFRVDYDNEKILYWKDKSRLMPDKSLPYNGEVGPLTGFFNYVFFYPAEPNINVINAMKRCEDIPGLEDYKKVYHIFRPQEARLRHEGNGNYKIKFDTSNLFDIVEGDIRFQLLGDSYADKVKLPSDVWVDALISKTKKNKRDKAMQQLIENKSMYKTAEFRYELEKTKQMDIFLAEDVYVELVDFCYDT